MPCFGTTDRTYENACLLAKTLGVTLREVDIRESVTRHFADIGQDMECHDVTYENGQARERTQVLMDIANKEMHWSLVREICRNWHWAGPPTTETICPCMASMPVYPRHWCGIWWTIMRIPVKQGTYGSIEGCAGYPGQSGTAPAGGRKHCTEDGRSGRVLRTA